MKEAKPDATLAIDFAQIAENIRNYHTPTDEWHSPYSIDAAHEGMTPQVLSSLIHALYDRDVSPDKCAFYLPHAWFNEYRMRDDVYTYGGGNSFQGRPIRTHATVPEDVVLFFAPDAVGLGGKVYNPLCIAYADVGSPPE